MSKTVGNALLVPRIATDPLPREKKNMTRSLSVIVQAIHWEIKEEAFVRLCQPCLPQTLAAAFEPPE